MSIIYSVCYSQSYQITSFHDTYEELENYSSLMLELYGELNWAHVFSFDFDFPFYDRNYSYIFCDKESACSFNDDLNYPIHLLVFGYEPDNVLDPNNIDSDLRYGHVEKDGKLAFVMQFTKNRLDSDPSVEEFDSYINFQNWFYEDGTIEIRFGDINLDNSPVYVPGEGFYLIPLELPPILHGPAVGLRDKNNPQNGIGLSGSYNNFNTTHSPSYLTVLPPEGWVIRFSRIETSTENNGYNSFVVKPNPTSGVLFFDFERKIEKIEVYTICGKKLKQFNQPNHSIDISIFSQGIYLLKVYGQNFCFTKKIIKN